jgi:hypothetical protein
MHPLAAGSLACAVVYSAFDTLRRTRRAAKQPRLSEARLPRPPPREPEQVYINGALIGVDPANALSPFSCFLLETAAVWALVFALLNVASLCTSAVDYRHVHVPYFTHWSWCVCGGFIYIAVLNAVHNVQTIWRDAIVAPEDSPYTRRFWARAILRAFVKGSILYAFYLAALHPVQAFSLVALLYTCLFGGDFCGACEYTVATAAFLALRLVEP